MSLNKVFVGLLSICNIVIKHKETSCPEDEEEEAAQSKTSCHQMSLSILHLFDANKHTLQDVESGTHHVNHAGYWKHTSSWLSTFSIEKMKYKEAKYLRHKYNYVYY